MKTHGNSPTRRTETIMCRRKGDTSQYISNEQGCRRVDFSKRSFFQKAVFLAERAGIDANVFADTLRGPI